MEFVAAPRESVEEGPVFVPVERETVQDRVYGELRRALVSGLIEPGTVLTIRALADQLQTSTMPVREAIGRLVSENALEALPNRSVRVPPVTLARLDDLLRARAMIEGEAIALAAERIEARGTAAIRAILSEWDSVRDQAEREDFDREMTLNHRFHFEIYRHCGSAVLMPVIESLWLQSGPCIRAAALAFSATGEADTTHYHRTIVEALEAGDAGRARAALIADISRPFTTLRQRLTAA
ncbi:GntR family transcriptional regulator [Xaviernesmea oryzae]|uniref:GntR family transcriptional regulator n=1 Tax=Xaviernesmea oryzae TaxID=464029 RepID=A0A1Q9AQZ4_9HYPH|nr:GntR family transcriptional regulator [Xaviernesmea oryzae]OLP57801.1 GntR family transcriptional regulator [Xaviernesmea oryzae]SEL36481.1 DNA-binding transcriptional regulator, GntR family [Xaviernesmea oryzae]